MNLTLVYAKLYDGVVGYLSISKPDCAAALPTHMRMGCQPFKELLPGPLSKSYADLLFSLSEINHFFCLAFGPVVVILGLRSLPTLTVL